MSTDYGRALAGPTLTKAERADLQKVARLRARVARSAIGTREAELVAQMEAELSATYPQNDPRWDDIAKAAREAVASADSQIARLCTEAGIPAEFRPGMNVYWSGRGENGSRDRRAELRKLGTAEIQAAGLTARAAIDRAELGALERIVSDGLTSEAAQRCLASIPTADELMAAPAVSELEAKRSRSAGQQRAERRGYMRGIDGGLND